MTVLQSNLLSEFFSNIDTRSVFDVYDVEKSLNKLKIGKACGLDNITKEFVMYSHPAIVVHLKLLFNSMVHHGFTPDSFDNGVIISLVKDKKGDLCNIDNYRGITLSFSKLVEHCILDKYDYLLLSNYLQLGFKKHSSCSYAIFVLRQVADFFVTHDSNVYMAALDATKAFVRVHHLKLFNGLSDCKIPFLIIKVIVN